MPSLIKSIALRNFKGFSDEVRIDIKPVTLLFGANSAGKSSILQAMQYVREILERSNLNADRTLQGGDAVDLGGFLNLVNGRDASKSIEIEIGMQLGDEPVPELVPDSFEDWQSDEGDVWEFYSALQDIRNRVTEVSLRLEVSWSEMRSAAFVSQYTVSANGEWCARILASGDGRDASMSINPLNPIFMAEAGVVDEDLLADLLGDAFSVDEALGTASDTAGLASVWHDLIGLMEGYGIQRPASGLRAWLGDSQLLGALPKLDRMLSIPIPQADGAAGIYIAREFTAFMSWLTIGPAMLLRDQLRQLRYIGPLRRIPPRGFSVSLTPRESAWSDGMAAWERLISGPASLVEDCSRWMSQPDKLATGYGLQRATLQQMELVDGVASARGPETRRIFLADQAGLRHQPQDVGVGISQVLPVVVAACDPQASLVCIEQPELHVHPSVQVGIGDLLLDGALNNGLSFLIETHSEHLILRLLRRIRETAENELPDGMHAVTPDDVMVVYLEKTAGSVTAHALPINEQGDFDTPWPRGFFEERGEELF
ncbi:hypothetical protein ACG97_11880 [Vogesella sp. EB]|uniref:AAA family ATPase n=1 Tax=Vogesella sp. EB TaxID=1526735 RepID=UPI00064D3421|nr:DUF3696 domain-containing protein [Vogesella sp. EB]KMJ52761.1 hypothetical protein ACG97_11880 [Vogesella sp. EB]